MVARKKVPSLVDVLASASLIESVVSVCVAGKLVGDYQALEQEMDRARESDRAGSRLGSGDGEATRVAREMRDLEKQMRDATYEFRFRALPPKAWSDLLTAHPDKDKKRLFDTETFPVAAIAACCVEPEGMDDPEKVAELMMVISSGQQSDLFEAAWEVNNSAPKELTSSAASAILRAYEKNLDTAANTESPGASSSVE